MFREGFDPELFQVRLVLFQKMELIGKFCSVGQKHQQAVRLRLGLGQEQGTHAGPRVGLLLLTQDLSQFLSVILLKCLTAGGLIEL